MLNSPSTNTWSQANSSVCDVSVGARKFCVSLIGGLGSGVIMYCYWPAKVVSWSNIDRENSILLTVNSIHIINGKEYGFNKNFISVFPVSRYVL